MMQRRKTEERAIVRERGFRTVAFGLCEAYEG